MEESRPVVVNPEGCERGCHGCGNLCPAGSMEYSGDMTDWVAFNTWHGWVCSYGKCLALMDLIIFERSGLNVFSY